MLLHLGTSSPSRQLLRINVLGRQDTTSECNVLASTSEVTDVEKRSKGGGDIRMLFVWRCVSRAVY